MKHLFKHLFVLVLFTVFMTGMAGCGKSSAEITYLKENAAGGTSSGGSSTTGGISSGGSSAAGGTSSGESTITAGTSSGANTVGSGTTGTETAQDTTGSEVTQNVAGVSGEQAQSYAEAEVSRVYVSVLGEVIKPGVYILKEGSRIYEAINLAGGITENADITGINLVSMLEDGMQIVIPAVQTGTAGSSSSGNSSASGTNTSGSGTAGGIYSGSSSGQIYTSGTGSTSQTASGKVNINTATLEELMSLTGIGEVRAKAIIDYREVNGNFSSCEDVMKVSGIKESTYAKFADEICVN